MSGNREAMTPDQPSNAVPSDYETAKRQHELRYTRRFFALISGVLVGSVTLLLAFVFAFPEVPYRKVVLFIQVVLSPLMFVVFAAGAYYYGVQARRYPPE